MRTVLIHETCIHIYAQKTVFLKETRKHVELPLYTETEAGHPKYCGQREAGHLKYWRQKKRMGNG